MNALRRVIRGGVRLIAAVGLGLASCGPAAASHLVTGNGFGFAVVAPEIGVATKFYAHPHSFTVPDPANPLSEGIETANFIKALGYGQAGQRRTTDYVDDTHVIRMRSASGNADYFMPFGLARPALIISLEAATPWRVEWNRPIRSQRRLASGTMLLRFEGIDEPLLLVPLAATRSAPANQQLAASSAWALIALKDESEAAAAIREVGRWRANLSTRVLVKRELAQFERWRANPSVRFVNDKERHLWRQSETMLRIAQSREPNRPGRYGNGLIVAALPDVYATPWVRDMAWATVALARMGHRAEARAALLAYFNARPTGKMRAEVHGADYQVSVVRYFGNGEEEPFFTQEGATNIEYDDWGEVLWVLGEYLRRYDDPALLETATYRGRLYESARDFIVRPLLANTEPYGGGRIVAADTSIWEERQKDRKHFAFSTALAIVGLHNFAEVAQRAGDQAARNNALAQAALLETGFAAAFIRDGKLRGTLEDGVKNDIDGALLPIINFGVVRDANVIRDTVDRMELLKVASGGYRRVRSTYTDPKIFEYWYERQEFLFVDLHLAQLYHALGRKSDADAMLQRIVNKAAADHNIIPEMYVAVPCALFPGKIGDPTGALPMVGYGAGAYVLHLLDR
ncbi:glycoside hydrolase family 15 protein [Sphingomonas sp. URHD0057]|uniref:glycoside hydrolase family 15 protein n=1 Tax=Sphingomonas sp. URHD0057 TaxID=1380389 RepID=UPI00068643DF|nr:glycoside hydrolase family 15 protein [Sphingomonas sp. URHD0057]